MIEDCIGSAQFVGEFSGDELKFVKVYDEMAVELGGVKEPIIYRAVIKDGVYTGTYGINNGRDAIEREFRLENPKDIAVSMDRK